MFGRKKTVPVDKGAKFLDEFLDYQIETERMKDAARGSQRSVAILKPQIPIGVGPAAGWFGGAAALPQGMAWPEQDGKKLLFVGQINLSALPQDLWAGAGPRSGWLGIFLPEQWPPNPTILQFDGALVDVKAPHPNNAVWTAIHDFKKPMTFALPKWPLVVERRAGNELHDVEDSSDLETQQDEDSPDVEPQLPSLLDRAYQPFNLDTVSLLFSALDEEVTRLARDIVRFPAMKKLRPADAAWFARMRPTVLHTFVRFFEIEAGWRSSRAVDPATIARLIDEIAELDSYEMEYLRNDGDGYSELTLTERKLLDRKPGTARLGPWWASYETGLTNHAIKAYTSAPEILPPALRERLEAEWQSQTEDGLAIMGHAPRGHIYTPHGPDTPTEVLLEIHTSKIAGFAWADSHSLVLLIDRDALRRGDFSDVTFDITN